MSYPALDSVIELAGALSKAVKDARANGANVFADLPDVIAVLSDVSAVSKLAPGLPDELKALLSDPAGLATELSKLIGSLADIVLACEEIAKESHA